MENMLIMVVKPSIVGGGCGGGGGASKAAANCNNAELLCLCRGWTPSLNHAIMNRQGSGFISLGLSYLC